MLETILIRGRRGAGAADVRDWARHLRAGLQVLTAADAEAALVLANQQTIDLPSSTGTRRRQRRPAAARRPVRLQPAVIAIMITGFATRRRRWTPCAWAVRDYLDKNQDLTAPLPHRRPPPAGVRPAGEARAAAAPGAGGVRERFEKVLPLVRSAAA